MTVHGPEQDIARGKIDGYSYLHKFGARTAVVATKVDVWDAGFDETLLTTGEIMYAASPDNTATQTIRVIGLDEDWLDQTVDVVLTGQTPVRVGATALWTRIARAFQVSAAPAPAAAVWIAENSGDFLLGVPQTNSNIHGLIDYLAADQHNQTLKAMVTVPAGKEFLIQKIAARMLQSTGTRRTVEVHLEIQELAEGATPASPSWAPFRAVRELVLDSETRVADSLLFPFPEVVGELTNVHMRAVASASTDVRATFDGFFMPAVD
jgi:hypothetical protein